MSHAESMIALQVKDSAERLMSAATDFVDWNSLSNRDDFLDRMRAMLQIIGVAMQDFGA